MSSILVLASKCTDQNSVHAISLLCFGYDLSSFKIEGDLFGVLSGIELEKSKLNCWYVMQMQMLIDRKHESLSIPPPDR